MHHRSEDCGHPYALRHLGATAVTSRAARAGVRQYTQEALRYHRQVVASPMARRFAGYPVSPFTDDQLA